MQYSTDVRNMWEVSMEGSHTYLHFLIMVENGYTELSSVNVGIPQVLGSLLYLLYAADMAAHQNLQYHSNIYR
jgi:hypothetical protein